MDEKIDSKKNYHQQKFVNKKWTKITIGLKQSLHTQLIGVIKQEKKL